MDSAGKMSGMLPRARFKPSLKAKKIQAKLIMKQATETARLLSDLFMVAQKIEGGILHSVGKVLPERNVEHLGDRQGNRRGNHLHGVVKRFFWVTFWG